MTCDSCGQLLDPDDEIDYTGTNYSVTEDGWSRQVKAVCPNCGHIQYGRYSEFEDPEERYIDGDDSD